MANGCSPYAYEENDEFWLAAPIAANLYTALTICSGDDDFYSITLSVQSLLEVDLTFFQVEGDIDLIVKNAVGALVGSSNSTTDNESVSIPSLPAGIYTPPWCRSRSLSFLLFRLPFFGAGPLVFSVEESPSSKPGTCCRVSKTWFFFSMRRRWASVS